MDVGGFAAVGEKLDAFAAQVFSSFRRADQRATGGLYLRGLMLDGRRKSMQPMAERLGVDHQRLQQFITTSPWDVLPVRKALVRLAIGVIGPQAWVIDDTGQAKEGTASACVARQYSDTMGKIGNCQVAVSVHAVTDKASAPLDWRLFMPKSWDDEAADSLQAAAAVAARREACKIPAVEHHRAKWQMAIEMLDELAEWGYRPPVVAADAGYGDTTAFRVALEGQDIGYVVAVKGSTSAYTADAVPVTAVYSGRGRPPVPRYPLAPASCKDIVLAAGRAARKELTWRKGTRSSPDNKCAAMRSHFVAVADPSGQPGHRSSRRWNPARKVADRRMAHRQKRTHRLLALQPAHRHPDPRTRPAGEDPLAHRTRLPRTEKPVSDLTISKVAAGPDGTTTPPWPLPPTCS